MDPAPHPEKSPLFPTRSYEITPRIRAWRQTLERCRSAAQVCLCLAQLERSIAWEKSVNKVVRGLGSLRRQPAGEGGVTGRQRLEGSLGLLPTLV